MREDIARQTTALLIPGYASGGGVGNFLPPSSFRSGLGGLTTVIGVGGPSSDPSPETTLPLRIGSSPSSGIVGLMRPPASSLGTLLVVLACCLLRLRFSLSLSAFSLLRRMTKEPSLASDDPPCRPSSMAAARSATSPPADVSVGLVTETD